MEGRFDCHYKLSRLYRALRGASTLFKLSDLFPSVLFQINFPHAAKFHALLSQTRALFVIAAGWPHADLALCVDNAMPGDIVFACAHRPANRARGRRRRAKRPRNLPIRDDAPPRDFPNERVDAPEKVIGRRRMQRNMIAQQMNLRASTVRSRPSSARIQSAKADLAFRLPRIHSPGNHCPAFNAFSNFSNAASYLSASRFQPLKSPTTFASTSAFLGCSHSSKM